ncbi:MAG: DUF87 domain-containing protein [Acidobacteria bacterium]|nr:DUF87 domain-containing protein [Acidobacteriota bacterium]
MTSVVHSIGDRVVGTVEEVSADRITVLLDVDAPQATALNTGRPTGFPRINNYVLIPNEGGATACVISSVRIQRFPFPMRKGMQKDFGLVDLPFPARMMSVTPLGTLRVRSEGEDYSFEVRRGVDVFPSVGDPVLLPGAEQLSAIVEGEARASQRILIGRCPTAGRAAVHVDPDKLFGRHLAVLGNTGAGKSCSVAGLIRWSLDAARRAREKKTDGDGEAPNPVPNARFIVLDPNGEYARAFGGFDVRLFRVEPGTDGNPLQVPAWLWNGAEWAAFSGAAPGVQRPVLFDALRRARSGLGPPDAFETKAGGRAKRYRNRLNVIIQSGDHQGRGKREDVAEVLLNVHKDFEDLVSDPDCTEDLRPVLQAAAVTARNAEEGARSGRRDGGHWHNDFAEATLESVIERIGEVAVELGLPDDDGVVDEDTPRPFSVDELPGYVDALAAGQSGRDVAQFVDTLSLRIRGLLAQGRLASVLRPDETAPITLEDWLTSYVGADQAKNGPIAVIDLSLVPSEVIHIVVSVLGRMVFEAVQRYRRDGGQELPTTLVLEEAHTFVHRELTGETASAAGRACARVFEKIAREGRKFGLGLVLASQRPSEVSPTVLSQCNTFLLHRLVNDRDQELVKRLVPDGLGPLLRELPSLPTRRAILLGWAAPAPILVEVEEIAAEFRPHSPDPAFWDVWTGAEQRDINWKKIARSWQGLDPEPPELGQRGEEPTTGVDDDN